MKKIVFFDTWVSALRQIDVIAKYLHNDYYIVFLSIDKMNNKSLSKQFVSHNKSAYLSREKNNKFYHKIVDITDYNNSMKAFFEIEQPDLCITISLHNLEQRWFNIVCKYYNVPIYLLMHGIKGKAVFNKKRNNLLKKILSFNSIKRLIHYNVLYFLYVKEKRQLHIKGSSSFSEWLQLLFNTNNFKFAPKDSYNVQYDKLFVTTASDIDFFKKQYPTLKESDYFVIGSLDLINIVEELQLSKNVPTEFALFLGQPLEPMITRLKYVELILNLSQICKENGIKFIFRPHPRENKETVKLIANNEVEISESLLSDDLNRSFFAISFTSTALLTALSLKIPVISFRIPNFVHPEFLQNNEISYVFSNVDEVSNEVINEVLSFNKDAKDFKIVNPIEIISEEILIELNK